MGSRLSTPRAIDAAVKYEKNEPSLFFNACGRKAAKHKRFTKGPAAERIISALYEISFVSVLRRAPRRLKENSEKFGFILRYPDGKSGILEAKPDPTQFRYVGRYHAVRINDLEMTLDEYCKYLGL